MPRGSYVRLTRQFRVEFRNSSHEPQQSQSVVNSRGQHEHVAQDNECCEWQARVGRTCGDEASCGYGSAVSRRRPRATLPQNSQRLARWERSSRSRRRNCRPRRPQRGARGGNSRSGLQKLSVWSITNAGVRSRRASGPDRRTETVPRARRLSPSEPIVRPCLGSPSTPPSHAAHAVQHHPQGDTSRRGQSCGSAKGISRRTSRNR